MAEAAAAGVGLIFTYVYAHPIDADDVAAIVAPFRADDIHFVRLTCPPEILFGRVPAESRRAYGKLVDVETLRGLMERHDLLSPVPHGESLTIDTNQLEPAEAARRIAEHYGLTLVPQSSTL